MHVENPLEPNFHARAPIWTSSAVIALVIYFGSCLLILTLPEGTLIENDALWEGVQGFTDFPDKIVLLFWLAVFSVSWFVAFLRPLGRSAKSSGHNGTDHAQTFTLIAAILATYLAYSATDNQLNYWPGPSPFVLVIVQATLLAIITFRSHLTKALAVINLGSVVIAGVFLIAAAFQLPNHVRDAYHSTIVVNDILAQSANQFPLGNTSATYTTLLGWPMRWFLSISPGMEPISTSITYLLILQFVTIALAIYLLLTNSAKRYWGPVLLVTLAWVVFDPSDSGQTAFQSFAINPARLFIPMVGIAILIRTYKKSQTDRQLFTGVMLTGAIAALAAVNNLEFGASIWLTLLAIVIFVPLGQFSLVLRILSYLGGSFAALGGLFALMTLSGESVHLDLLLRVPLIYSAAGVDLLPMPAIGLQLVFVTCFIVSVFVGARIVRSSPRNSTSGNLGLVLLVFGTWSSLSLTYYSGRSVTSALIAGYGMQMGILAGVYLLLLIRHKFMSPTRLRSSTVNLNAIWLSIPVAIALSLYIIGLDPRSTLAAGQVAGPINNQLDFNFNSSPTSQEYYKELFQSESETTQSIYPANIRALSTGIRSETRAPELFLNVSSALGSSECSVPGTNLYWIVESQIADRLISTQECAKSWVHTGFGGTTEDGKVFTVLKRRESS